MQPWMLTVGLIVVVMGGAAIAGWIAAGREAARENSESSNDGADSNGESREYPSLPDWRLTIGGKKIVDLKQALESGDFEAAGRALADTKDGPWTERSLILDVCDDLISYEDAAALVEKNGDGHHQLLAGSCGLTYASGIRGAKLASEVAEEAWDPFHAALEKTEAHLSKAAQLLPSDPTPWSVLIRVSMSQGGERERACFDEAVRRDPVNFDAYIAMLSASCAKWGGSHEEMFAHAERGLALAQKNPAAANLAALTPLAHIERWLMYSISDEDEEAEEYPHRPEIREAVARAWDLFKGPGEPSGPNTLYDVYARNAFAAWFYLSEDKERLRPAMQMVGDARVSHPWHYIANPLESFFEAREMAGLS